MKASRQQIGRSVDQPSADLRFYLFHGPDEAQSRALAARLAEGLGAEKFSIASSAIKSDPAALCDEAGAMNLFGGTRVVWIEPAGDEIAAGVEALLEAPSVESPVVAVAGALRKTSALLKLAEASPAALAFAAYPPEGLEAARMVTDVGRRFGLKIDQALAAQLADGCGNDQAIVAQELQKFALFIDASPQSPKALEPATVEAIGADLAESNVSRLADLALAGEIQEFVEELVQQPDGVDAIPVVRALQRRLTMLAPARARVERGDTPDAVMASFGKSMFFRDKPVVARMLRLWDSRSLATVAQRVGEFERELMRPRARPNSAMPAFEALGEELMAIARAARSRR
jgi:DNA polymerase-3 subunit delta